jgi:hypothetical protein
VTCFRDFLLCSYCVSVSVNVSVVHGTNLVVHGTTYVVWSLTVSKFFLVPLLGFLGLGPFLELFVAV